MKKLLAITLILATLISLAIPAFAATPRLVDASVATVTLSISSTGRATVIVRVNGKSTLTKVETVTYIEKLVGSTWTRVDIDTDNDAWEYSTTSRTFTKNYTAQLNSAGQYRAVTEFTLTGSTVEEFTKTSLATY